MSPEELDRLRQLHEQLPPAPWQEPGNPENYDMPDLITDRDGDTIAEGAGFIPTTIHALANHLKEKKMNTPEYTSLFDHLFTEEGKSNTNLDWEAIKTRPAKAINTDDEELTATTYNELEELLEGREHEEWEIFVQAPIPTKENK